MGNETRDDLGRVLCCHGRPMMCLECGEDYAAELNQPRAAALDAAPSPEKKCVIGEYCHTHGWIHGQEAEQLRERVEKILDEVDYEGDDAANELDRALRIMLDEVDARDSAAFISARVINIEGIDGGPIPERSAGAAGPVPPSAKPQQVISALHGLRADIEAGRDREHWLSRLEVEINALSGFSQSTVPPSAPASPAQVVGAPIYDKVAATVSCPACKAVLYNVTTAKPRPFTLSDDDDPRVDGVPSDRPLGSSASENEPK